MHILVEFHLFIKAGGRAEGNFKNYLIYFELGIKRCDVKIVYDFTGISQSYNVLGISEIRA